MPSGSASTPRQGLRIVAAVRSKPLPAVPAWNRRHVSGQRLGNASLG